MYIYIYLELLFGIIFINILKYYIINYIYYVMNIWFILILNIYGILLFFDFYNLD
jgi:hypothetical protein